MKNKNLLPICLAMIIISGIALVLAPPWDISTASYFQNFSIAGQETEATGIFFNPNGTGFYVLGYTNDNLHQFNLTIAWDVSSAIWLQNFSVGGESAIPSGIFFEPNGSKFYLPDNQLGDIEEYNMSIYWNVSDAIYVKGFSVSAQDGDPTGVFFNPNGTGMYMTGSDKDGVSQYTLSMPWNSSSATYLQNISLSAQAFNPTGIFIRSDGFKMYMTSFTNLYEYDLAIPWNVSSATYLQNISIVSAETGTTGAFFKDDGLKFYLMGSSTNSILEYNVLDIIFPEVTIVKPSNYSNLSSTTFDLNYTFIELNPDSCWYSNDSGIINSTSISMGTNWTALVGLEGNINRTVYCNDSANNINSSMVNFTIDITPPNLSIIEPTGTITTRIKNVTITVNDFLTAVNYCYFNISKGASTEVVNTEISLATLTKNFSASSDGDFITHVVCNDSLNNINYSTSSFTIDTSVAISGGGGGGGVPPEEELEEKIPFCEPALPPLKQAWEIFKEEKGEGLSVLWKNFKVLWYAYWNYGACQSTASFIPL